MFLKRKSDYEFTQPYVLRYELVFPTCVVGEGSVYSSCQRFIARFLFHVLEYRLPRLLIVGRLDGSRV
jgi:hypothetical protein